MVVFHDVQFDGMIPPIMKTPQAVPRSQEKFKLITIICLKLYSYKCCISREVEAFDNDNQDNSCCTLLLFINVLFKTKDTKNRPY